MKEFGGPAIFLDRNDINTDEIIPAKYLTEITKTGPEAASAGGPACSTANPSRPNPLPCSRPGW